MNLILKIARLLLIASLLAAAAPVRAQAAGAVYVVQPGDTFFGIARQFGLTLEVLQAANPTVNPDRIQIGQTLVIPGFEGLIGTLATHLLAPGESLDSLALRLGLRRETLIRLNRVVNPERLYVNQPIVIVDPADGGTPIATGRSSSDGSLLRLAAAHKLNPWALAALNRLPHPAALPPGAAVAIPGGEVPLNGLPAPLRSLSLGPFPLEQGRTLAVKIESDEGVTAAGQLGDWLLTFNADPADARQLAALVGVHRFAQPDLYPLTIVATDTAGAVAHFVQAVPVRQGRYGSEQLNVNPATLDPVVTQPEDERIQAAVRPNSPQRWWDGLFQLPSVGVIRSWFGTLRSYNGGPFNAYHTGVDFSGAEDRPITAPAPGVVVLAEALTVRGNATLIDHGWGVYSGFWHQSSILVAVGDRVETGQIVGYQGATGRVTGPHLHWELLVGGNRVDPLQWTEMAFP